MLPSISPRQALLACPPLHLPSFTVESTLSSPCFRSDSLLSRQGAAFVHLDSLPHTIWCSGQMALFFFLLAKATLVYLFCPLALSSSPCPLLHLSFYFSLSGRSVRNCLLSPLVLSGYNGSPNTRFSRETTRLMRWPEGGHYSCPLKFLVVSLLLSLVSTLVFSRTGGVLCHRNSLTHRFPRFPPRNLCFLKTFAVFSLVFAATDT